MPEVRKGTPTQGEVLAYGQVACTWLGTLFAAWTAQGLVALSIGSTQAAFLADLRRRFPNRPFIPAPDNAPLLADLRALVDGRKPPHVLPVDWDVLSPFQAQVLREAVRIPPGQTVSYGELARRIGKPGAARAVGRALATNPVPLVLPCHRVVGAEGDLRGYGTGQGTETKAALLAWERALRDRRIPR